MTKPKDDDVKRYWVEHGRGRLTAIYEEKVDGLDDDAFEVVRAADHDREVGNLIYELSSANATIAELESELATARKVIEKLREQRNNALEAMTTFGESRQYRDVILKAADAEIEAIEKGEDKT